MASGTISFGLVSIPIKLYSPYDSSSSVHFNQIHKKCGGRIKLQYHCPADEEVVTREEIVKGYEFAKDQYVLFTEEELEKLQVKATHAIEITEFIPLKEVDPVFFDGAYYLGPDKGGDRAYRLLAEAMKRTGRAALATYAARGKQYLVMLRPFDAGLIMQQLHYADEIRDFSEVPVGEAEVKKPELDMAIQLVDQRTSKRFDPSAYKDDIRLQLLEMIEKKIQGQEITAPPAEAPKAQIIDLMAALKASLGRTEGKEAKETRRPPKRAPREPAVKKARTSR